MQIRKYGKSKINVNQSNSINSVQWKKDKWHTHNQTVLYNYIIKLIEYMT